ncbi:Type 1 glutamine amidotransferase-like domain-containing protein, partial [Leuconostoc mesenteroides]|uniref:Type 1 glutamine amidotransferase-like domain-containing protein n=1 Tax=Leuconostoc mesenteroides TaxID=1245 RepID=UPI00388B1B7F
RCVQVYSLVQQRKNQSCQSKNKSCLISSALDKKHSELLTYEHAGSIVMGPSIEYLQYLYPEDNQFNDTDLTGLNLTSTTIFPHFKEMLTRDADIDKKLTSYENTTGVKIMRLNNDQALSCHCKDKVLID